MTSANPQKKTRLARLFQSFWMEDCYHHRWPLDPQRKIDKLLPPTARVTPSGDNTTDQRFSSVVKRVLIQLPLLISHRRVSPLPSDPEASDNPEGENAIEVIAPLRIAPVRPSKSLWLWSSSFHKRIDWSILSSEKETHLTDSVWPSKKVQLSFLPFQSSRAGPPHRQIHRQDFHRQMKMPLS
jgi:hypothetical protein